MNNQYFAWKDGKKNTNGSQEWTEISAEEYLNICKESKEPSTDKSRYFMKVAGISEDDSSLYFECDHSDYLKYRAEKEKIYRKKVQKLLDDMKYGTIQILSLDAEFEDESGDTYTLHDLIEDKDSLFEDKLIQSIDLFDALDELSVEERKIIDTLYFSSEPTTEKELAEQTGVPRTTLQSQKYKILKKLKKSFGIY